MIPNLLYIIFILSFIFINIKGIQVSNPISELNDFQTISENQEFYIKTNIMSIAYFDSYDSNCMVFANNERIDGKFYEIMSGQSYLISIKLYFNKSTCIVKRFLSDYYKDEFDIRDNSINYIFLRRSSYIYLNFANNNNDVLISLSRKTLDANVAVSYYGDGNILNKKNLYLKVDKTFKERILLFSETNDAFLELLFPIKDNDYEILNKSDYYDYQLKYKTTLFIIPYTQKEIRIQIKSNKPYLYSFSNGYSNNKDFYFDSVSNTNINPIKSPYYYKSEISFYTIYKNITLLEGEFFSFAINIKKDEDQIIYLTYKQFSSIDELLDEDIDESYCKNIINNFKDLFQYYVYSDIAKNPPEINEISNYHHEKIDFNKKLDEISIKNRKFYEFYQELQILLGKVKDRHLNVAADLTPMLTKFKYYYAFLPFNFIIKQYNSKYRIFIEKNYFEFYFGQNVIEFIEKNKEFPIKYINGIDAFDYIQNWSKFRNFKNPHAQFTKNIDTITYFYLNFYPLNYTDMSLNEYEFENGEILKIPYIIKNIKSNNIEFDNFFKNYQKSIGTFKNIPHPDNIYQKFLSFQRLLNNNENIDQQTQTNNDWDPSLSQIEDGNIFKCKVDHINKVNVIYQNSFYFKDIFLVVGKMLKCVSSFFNNDYPVIIIESKNGGGYAILYTILLQILQPRINFKEYEAFRITPLSEEKLKKERFERYIDQYDCHEINNYNDFKYFIEDNYDDIYEIQNIHHNRTSTFDSIPVYLRSALEEFREKISNSKNLKKPTDIIIFTDSYSFSAASSFIKGFQNTGGAVIVGFFGNPKIEGVSLFDSSQSPSVVEELEGTKIKDELKNNGYEIFGVTTRELYNFHQHNIKNQIPMEYSFNPVDFRVDIYSDYSDELYDIFIQEGLNIHKKLNQDKKCNPNNEILLLHDDDCQEVNGDIHAYGGYKCNSYNTWDKSQCYAYYCDIGYYFDQKLKKCIKNCQFDEKSYFIYEDNISLTFDIKKNINYNFIFPFFETKKYFIEMDYSGIKGKIKPLNYYRFESFKFPIDRKLKITEISTNISLIYLYNKNTKHSIISKSETLIFIDISEDYILYLDNIYKSAKTKVQIAEYKSEMTYDNILNIDQKYFFDFNENIKTLSKDNMYLLYINFVDLDPFNVFIGPKNNFETIEIIGLELDFLYLEKNKISTLDFRKNLINRMIKLSRETLNSEIKILNKDFVLNSENLYYPVDDNYKEKLILKVEKENALIEFLFKQDYKDIEVLYFEKKKFILNKKYNILPIPKKYSSKLIEIELFKNNFLTKLIIYLAYTIPPYNFFSSDIKENVITMNEKFKISLNEHYKGDINLMEGESYCVMIENFEKDVLMIVNIKDEDEKFVEDKNRMKLGNDDNIKYTK